METAPQQKPTEHWKVTMMHPDECAECEDAAEAAINHAKATGSTGAASSYYDDRDAFGQSVKTHEATVERLS